MYIDFNILIRQPGADHKIGSPPAPDWQTNFAL
jgi:hypothetical protein